MQYMLPPGLLPVRLGPWPPRRVRHDGCQTAARRRAPDSGQHGDGSRRAKGSAGIMTVLSCTRCGATRTMRYSSQGRDHRGRHMSMQQLPVEGGMTRPQLPSLALTCVHARGGSRGGQHVGGAARVASAVVGPRRQTVQRGWQQDVAPGSGRRVTGPLRVDNLAMPDDQGAAAMGGDA